MTSGWQPRPLVPESPLDLAAEVLRYVAWLEERGYSATLVWERRRELSFFVEWCRERSVTLPSDLSLSVLEHYQRHLSRRRTPAGARLCANTQEHYLIALREFCKWLRRCKLIDHNPAADLVMPRSPQRLPRDVLSRSELGQVLSTPDLGSPDGLRDRTLLEVLYSTGMRRAELVRLEINDIDLERGLVLIREGKNRKDRVIPIGERALAWIDKYLEDGRPALIVPPDDGVLFLSPKGRPFTPGALTNRLSKLLKESGVKKSGAVHIFRHTMATHMLEGGADTRFIQQMLGHESLATTQVYTRVEVSQLKAIHDATHPGAHLHPPSDQGDQTAPEQEGSDPEGPLDSTDQGPEDDGFDDLGISESLVN